jgi:hypothetical protein
VILKVFKLPQGARKKGSNPKKKKKKKKVKKVARFFYTWGLHSECVVAKILKG